MTTYPISYSADTPYRRGQAQATRLGWIDAVLSLALTGVVLLNYARTLAAGLLPGDSGEFQTLALLLGHTHPTGYPVYLALARAFAWLPVADLATRINLFSAVSATLAVLGVFLTGRLITGQRWVALIGALALAVSPTFWSQALIAEVYGPGAAFFSLILLAVIWWWSSGKAWALLAAGLLGGLSLGVHMSVALLAPAVLVFLLLSPPSGWAKWRPALLGAGAGLLLTLLLFFLIDRHNPPANYFSAVIEPSRSAWALAAEDIDGPLDRLLFGWSAQQFRPFMFAEPASVMGRLASQYWQNLGVELSRPGIILALIGAVTLLMRAPRLALLLLLALAIQLAYTFNYDIWDVYVFFIPSYLLLALLAAAGLGGIVDGLRRLSRRWPRSGPLLDLAVAAAALALVVWPVWKPNAQAVVAGEVPFAFDGYPVDDFSQNTLHPLVSATVRALPENAVLFTEWDMLYPYYYVAHVEQERLDLTFLETFPRDDTDSLAESVVDYVAGTAEKRPIYVSERLPRLAEAGYDFAPSRIGPTLLLKVTQFEDD